jgi:hypothetical protein
MTTSTHTRAGGLEMTSCGANVNKEMPKGHLGEFKLSLSDERAQSDEFLQALKSLIENSKKFCERVGGGR